MRKHPYRTARRAPPTVTTAALGVWLEATFAKAERDGLATITLPCPFDCGQQVRASPLDTAEEQYVDHDTPHCPRWTHEMGVLIARLETYDTPASKP